jgi:hypothetical protein
MRIEIDSQSHDDNDWDSKKNILFRFYPNQAIQIAILLQLPAEH